METYRRRSGTAAVSESIGFLLIFSLVMVGIGLVTLYGYPVLLQQQSNADERIMEKNMIVLQNDLKSLTFKSVPYKETSLKVGGGALTVFNHSLTTQAFEIYNGPALLVRFQPGELRYRSTSENVISSIENGAVIYRQYGSAGSVMLAEPRWFYDAPTKTAVIYLIGINSSGILARTGVGNVRMELPATQASPAGALPNPVVSQYSTVGNTVTVKYIPDPDNDFSTAWNNYFVNTLNYVDNGLGGYDLPVTDTLVIKQYEVQVNSV